VSLDQSKLLQIAGKRGLSNAQLLGGEATAQVFLVIDPGIGDEAEDLAVAKCFSRIHRVCNYALTCIFIHRFREGVNGNRRYGALMQVSQQVSTRTLDFAG
jgi:hypothetical protein